MQGRSSWRDLYRLEDWWAVWLGAVLLGTVMAGPVTSVPALAKWGIGSGVGPLAGTSIIGLSALGLGLCAACTIAVRTMGQRQWLGYAAAFLVLFVLTIGINAIAEEQSVRYYGISDAFWALALGLLVSNTIRTPDWLKPAVKTEFYIKTGLVIMGAEILFGKIVEFGVYGLAIAWGVTPAIVVFMWLFGTRVLKMANKPLVIVIATATSVCGVSAAIAAAAASRAKRDDLTLAVGMTLIFTVLMMIFMPMGIKALGMDPVVGGAWIGGTIDSTGAVVAAGAELGPEAETAAALVKMIQNVLIGVIAFCIAVYWVSRVERDPSGPRPSLMELWYRFPKFILGFLAASVVVSFILIPLWDEAQVEALLKETKNYRGWLFTLAFLSIGLESNFKDLAAQLAGGKPIVLYLVGQSVNLVVTLIVVWAVLSGSFFAVPVLGGP